MRFKALVASVLVLLGACSGPDATAPTVTPAPKVETVTLVTATLVDSLDSSVPTMYSMLGPITSDSTKYRDNSQTLINLPPFNVANITLPTGTKTARLTIFQAVNTLNFVGDGKTQMSFRYLSDWAPKSASLNMTVAKIAHLFVETSGYTMTEKGVFLAPIPATVLHQTAVASDFIAFTVQVPKDKDVVRFYRPAESYDFTCGEGRSSVIFKGDKGSTYVVTMSPETYGTFTYASVRAPTVKIECTTYSNIQAARIANPTLQIGQ